MGVQQLQGEHVHVHSPAICGNMISSGCSRRQDTIVLLRAPAHEDVPFANIPRTWARPK